MIVFFSILIRPICSIYIGIDFGSQFTKSYVVNTTERPEIGLNYQSKRVTPTFVAFRSTKSFDFDQKGVLNNSEAEDLIPLFGEKALNSVDNKCNTGVGYFPYFVDIDDSESDFFSSKVYIRRNLSRIGYNELITLYFKQYIECISNNNPVNGVCVVVPATFTMVQRRAIESAIYNSGIKTYSVIDDNVAVSNVYALEKVDRFYNDPKTVMFLDIGSTSIKAYVTNFSLQKDSNGKSGRVVATRHSYSIDMKEGGSFLTSRMVEFLVAKYKLENISTIELRRVFSAAEKLKLSLTLISTSSVVFESLDGNDITLTMTRDEYDSLLGPMENSVLSIMKEASFGLNITDLEIIGGSSRIPTIQNFIKTQAKMIFGIEVVGKGLNADETIALGAGYNEQFVRGVSRFQSIISNEFSPLSISFRDNDTDILVCKKGMDCDTFFSTNGSVSEFEIVHDPSELPLSVISNRFKLLVKPGTEDSFVMRFKFNPFVIQSAKHCNSTNCTNSIIAPLYAHVAPSPIYFSILNSDAKRKRLGKARNNLEQLALQILEDIEHNEAFKYYTNESQRYTIFNQASKIKSWINNNADIINDENEFIQKYHQLRGIITPVQNRIKKNQSLTQIIPMLFQTLQLGLYSAYLEWPVNNTYLNVSTTEGFKTLLNETKEWSEKLMKDIEKTNPWEEILYEQEEVKRKALSLYQELLRISAIPRPTAEKFSFFKNLFRKAKGIFSSKSKPKNSTRSQSDNIL